VVKDIVLCLDLLSLIVKVPDFFFIVSLIEDFELAKLDYAVVIRVDFLEQRSNFQSFQTQIEVFAQVDLEVFKSQESKPVGIESQERALNLHSLGHSLLNGFEHSISCNFFIEL